MFDEYTVLVLWLFFAMYVILLVPLGFSRCVVGFTHRGVFVALMLAAREPRRGVCCSAFGFECCWGCFDCCCPGVTGLWGCHQSTCQLRDLLSRGHNLRSTAMDDATVVSACDLGTRS